MKFLSTNLVRTKSCLCAKLCDHFELLKFLIETPCHSQPSRLDCLSVPLSVPLLTCTWTRGDTFSETQNMTLHEKKNETFELFRMETVKAAKSFRAVSVE